MTRSIDTPLSKRLEALIALQGARSRTQTPFLFVGRTPWPAAPFFVDPSNDSGNARDSNPGTSRAAPILSIAEFNRRTFLHDFQTLGTVVTFMSDDPTGTFIDPSTWAASTGSVTFQGTPTITRSGAFSTVTPIDPTGPGGGTRQSVTDGAFSFGPLQNQIIKVIGGGNDGTTAWIMSGTTSPSLTQPMQSSGLGVGAFSPGDSYEVQQGTLLQVGSFSTGPFNPTSFTFADISFGPTMTGFHAATYQRCSFQNSLSADGTFGSCLLESGFAMVNGGVVSFLGGGAILTEFDVAVCSIAFGFHPYMTGASLIASPAVYSSLFVTQGIQFQDIPSPAGALVVTCPGCIDTTTPSPPAKIWGNGNTGPGVRVSPGATLNVSTRAGLLPSVTGAGGDYVFTGPGGAGTLTKARAYDNASGNFTETGGPATRDTTWANFVATIGGGGFDFHAQTPETGAAIVGFP